LDGEETRHINARIKPRWLAVPEEIVMDTKSFNAAKSIIRLRLNFPTRNVMDGRTAKAAPPQCPWCHDHADSARHRFECDSLQPRREAFADKMWDAVAPSSPADFADQELEEHPAETDGWRWDKGQVLRANFTWDVLVKGDYKGGLFHKLERFTAPPKETRQALVGILHDFLEETRFFTSVFGWQADRTKDVEVAHNAYIEKRNLEAHDAHSKASETREHD
jgi:hypothetical protein